MKEFDSEFCNVKYVEKDKAILLAWKKFACGDDYRNPTTFAWELLKENVGSKFIVDARNGFEDEKADVEWGFTVLLPRMTQTTCKMVCFIMNEVNDIEEEMDMWTKEFGKYFAVIKASDYENALEKMKRLLMVNVRYHIHKGKRNEFYNKVKEQGIIQSSKEEPGNYKYDYYVPKNSDDAICLMEIWTNEQAQKMHGFTEQYQKLTILKQEYVESVEIEKYWISEV
ncbi:hypothetical protein SPSIL_055630 [Sporomusa silvacetica DSM 10669]|uniref:ABM domain-containing protein n=1 Tax=Sporomusa silvacetica DSM 10669 TaxID=1123289 RepID=A0ABZ3IUY2_9FIRM|nr:antibiotic biosynthesis monooxygenase [Sporomusa silvacetica]OZC16609.1 antibiotic biosynthesis monooxygenase [Sporomusa silvacetica DSM 10669]